MLNYKKILAVALYEFKTLRRSWLFRIFAFLSIAVIILLNIVLYVYSETSYWSLRGIPSSIPYMNLLVLNVIQGIIGIFVATEFFKNDKLHDFTESVYTRSMTNADYLIGKTLGICGLFLFLNVCVLIISSVFNIVFIDDVPFIIKSYVYYPIIISIPTLIYIFGLSLFLMVVIKSQALTILILLGYSICSLIVLGGNYHQLFDYSAFNLPLMSSDFIGFGNIGTILIQRGMYLLMGAGFIFSTVLMFKRPTQSKKMNRISLIAVIVCFGITVLLASVYISNATAGKKLRSRMNTLNNETASKPRLSITDCSLDLVHSGTNIDVSSHVTFENKTSSPIDSYIFSLNPGLEILDVTSNGEKLTFSRDLHILTVEPQTALYAGGIDSLSIHYRGSITEDAAYVDIGESTRQELFKLFMYNIDKRYGFITPEYVLLTHENLWYPVAGIPYGSVFPSLQNKDFINFGLSVTTDSELTAISQGEMKRTGNNDFVFTPDVPMPQLSLVIGRYENYSLTVENTDYNIFYLEGHDYFSQYFNLIHDELPDLINESKMDFERTHILSYPYKRFSLVEVPIQFSSYDRLWTLSRENIQPEQVFLPEKGLFVTDFNRSNTVYISPNMENTPEEKQKNSYRSIVRNHIMQGNTVRQQQNNSVLNSLNGNNMKQKLRSVLYYNSDTRYNISPNYYSFVNNFTSDDWPIFNFSLEYFLFQKTLFESESQDRANIALSTQTFPEILAETKEWYDAYAVIRTKAEYIFTLIKSTLGNEVFEEFMYEYLNENRFKNVDMRDFIATVNERLNLDLEPHLDQWYNEKNLPAFRIADVNLYEVIHEDKTKYQITFKIHNTEDVDGVVLISFDAIPLGGFGGLGLVVVIGGNNAAEDRVVALKGNQSKEVSMLFDAKPYGVKINTLISQNLPSSVVVDYITSSQEPEENNTIEVYEGERIIDTSPEITEPGVIIVDNEDPGFKVLTQPKQSLMVRFLDKESDADDYIPFTTNNPPEKWTAAVQNDFYGIYKHTAHYIKSGTGTQKVEWNADIPENGKYDIYYHTTSTGGGVIRIGDTTLNNKKTVEDLNFKIYHDDGVDDKTVVDAEKGWTFLGTYPLSQGISKVELSDKSKGKIVYADAIKWVKKD
ncbi:M1 family aminopeptidase [Candidatus Latescibacterota bacterium]